MLIYEPLIDIHRQNFEYNDMEIEKDEEISELEDKIEELETEIKNLKNVNR